MSQNHLTALPIELHTEIFSNLQPYDILQVRQTCQALYLASSQRTVWVDALHRICVENTLFEPSFPVASMSVLELQHASMGPHRWVTRSSSKERNSDGLLPPRSVARHLMSASDISNIADLQSFGQHYLVPGGRYLFSFPVGWMVLWDLGSPYSSGKESRIISTGRVGFYGFYHVHPAPDGMGIRVVFVHSSFHDDMTSFYVYEIYPESTAPQFTQIAYTRIAGPDDPLYTLSYDCLIFENAYILTVWDYKANMWARWGVEGASCKQILATESAVVLIREHGVSVWEIPPLLPESSLSMGTDPSVVPPVFELHYLESKPSYMYYRVTGDWYSGTPQPLHYDVVKNSPPGPQKINRFQIVINSKISGGTLNLLKTFEVSMENYGFPLDSRICQNKTVSICSDIRRRLLGTHVTDIHDQQLPSYFTPLFRHPVSVSVGFCAATGRLVYSDTDQMPPSIIVLEF